MNGKQGPTDSELLDETIATAEEQTVGPNVVPLVAENIATGTSANG